MFLRVLETMAAFLSTANSKPSALISFTTPAASSSSGSFCCLSFAHHLRSPLNRRNNCRLVDACDKREGERKASTLEDAAAAAKQSRRNSIGPREDLPQLLLVAPLLQVLPFASLWQRKLSTCILDNLSKGFKQKGISIYPHMLPPSYGSWDFRRFGSCEARQFYLLITILNVHSVYHFQLAIGTQGSLWKSGRHHKPLI